MHKNYFDILINRLKIFLSKSVLSLTMAGCTSVTYQEPKMGPMARVRFATDTTNVTVVRGYGSLRCDNEHEMLRLRKGFVFNSGPRRLGIPLWLYHKNAAKELFIRPGIAQVYVFVGAKNIHPIYYTCGVMVQKIFCCKKKIFHLNLIFLK